MGVPQALQRTRPEKIKTIKQLCVDVSDSRADCKDWRSLSEEEVFQEIAICVIGSQMVFVRVLLWVLSR